MEKCLKCGSCSAFQEWDLDREGQRIEYLHCPICGNRDYLNGTNEVKFLRLLNQRVRDRLERRHRRNYWED